MSENVIAWDLGDYESLCVRTIESAPTDGTRVLVFVPKQIEIEGDTREIEGWFTAVFYNRFWHTGIPEWTDASCELEQPTHWMPLPKDPR